MSNYIIKSPKSNKYFDFLNKNYPLYGAGYCSKILGKSISATRHIANRLGLRYIKSKWTSEELSYIKCNYPKYSISECANAINKSYSIVRTKLKQLNIPITKLSKFTDYDIEFLIKYYNTIGAEKCAESLNKSSAAICRKANKLNLTLSTETRSRIAKLHSTEKSLCDYNVNPEQFKCIKTPEVAYILGLLWADGYVYQNIKLRNNQITIQCKAEDLKLLQHIFIRTGKWTSRYVNPPNRKPQLIIGTNNKILTNYLIEHDYISKSTVSADKILSRIPEHLQYYWFRGLVDGDGCFYINNKLKLYQFSIASSYNQDWTYAEHIFQELNIKYAIKRRKQLQHGKLNGSSVIRITNRGDIIKFGNYIYNNYNSDNIGLPRKYNKFKLITDSLK